MVAVTRVRRETERVQVLGIMLVLGAYLVFHGKEAHRQENRQIPRQISVDRERHVFHPRRRFSSRGSCSSKSRTS